MIRLNNRFPILLLALGAVVTAGQTHASAHQVIQLRGEIKLEARRVSILLRPTAHALAVLGANEDESGDRDCAEWLSHSLKLNDRSGLQLDIKPDTANQELHLFAMVQPSAWPLSLRWAPPPDRISRGRIALAWEVGDAQGHILLTSGGNVVCLDAPDSPPGPPIEPRMDIDATASTRLTIRLPLVLAADLFAFASPDANSLSPRSRRELRDAAAGQFEQMVRFRSGGIPPAAAKGKTEILIRGTAHDPTHPVNAWLAEIEWSHTWDAALDGPLEIEVSRKLLDLAPFAAKVTSEDGTIHEGLLTSADPSVIVASRKSAEQIAIGRRTWTEERNIGPIRPEP